MTRNANRGGDRDSMFSTMARSTAAEAAASRQSVARPNARLVPLPKAPPDLSNAPRGAPSGEEIAAAAPRPHGNPAMSPGSRESTTDDTRTAPPESPAGRRHVQRWLEIALLVAGLAVGITGWWLYLGEVKDTAKPPVPAPRAGSELAQTQQALPKERDNTEQSRRELAMARREQGSPVASPITGD